MTQSTARGGFCELIILMVTSKRRGIPPGKRSEVNDRLGATVLREQYLATYFRWRRSELSTTDTELMAMAMDAIMGFSLPTAATGMASVL